VLRGPDCLTVYIPYLVGFFTGITVLVGLIIAYLFPTYLVFADFTPPVAAPMPPLLALAAARRREAGGLKATARRLRT
jgi:hypothetical protein